MKLQTLSFASMLLACATLTLVTASCSNEPEKAHNEITEKEHEDPTKCVFILEEGTLKDGVDFNKNPKPEDFVGTNKKQTIIWKVVAGSNFKTDDAGLKKFTVKNIKANPKTVYALKMEYYNIAGELMNNQFYNNHQDRIHQHFFSMYEKGRRIKDVKKLPYEYTYADQAPDGKFIGDVNPLGFYGFIRFTGDTQTFELSVDLMHSGNQSKYDKDGKPSPYYSPAPSLIGSALWDLSVKLPILIDNSI